jgi:4-amino-4-deoxy-L-arabinose transferase-like glycosyltransferase
MTRSGAVLAFAILLWTVTVAVGLAVRPPLPVDETRYLAVAWEMWQRGDFLVPYINGIPYHHKPPLLFWLMQAGWTVVGVSETWGRVVAPLFALGSILLTAQLGKRLWPGSRDAGPVGALMLTGSALFAVFISLTFFDTLVTFFALLGWIGLIDAARALRDGTPMRRAWTVYAVALGLGILSKGPVQLLHVLPVALLAPLWMKDKPPGFARHWYGALALAVLGGAAVALAWAVPAAIAGGEDFARKIFLGQHTGRMVDSFQHGRPFWWYVPLAFAMLFPWLWWVAVWRRGIVARAVWREEGTRFCLCVIAPAFIVFSAISGKQPHYMLPLAAAACLVIGRLVTAPEGPEGRFERLPGVLPILACGIALLAAPLYADRLLAARPTLLLPGWLLALVAVCGVGLIAGSVAALRVGSMYRATAMLAALPIGLLVALHIGMLALRPTLDVGPVAAFLARAEATNTPVALLGDYEGQYHFAGRLKRQIPDVNHTTALSWAAAHPDGLLITSPRTLPDDATPAFTTPYRGRRIAIWHARDVVARGGALLNR